MAGGGDAGQPFQAFEGETLGIGDFLPTRIGRGRQEHGAADEVVGFIRTGGCSTREARARSWRAPEQNHGEGELADDQQVTEALMDAISGEAA